MKSYNLTRQEPFEVNELESIELPKTKEEQEEKKKVDIFKIIRRNKN